MRFRNNVIICCCNLQFWPCQSGTRYAFILVTRQQQLIVHCHQLPKDVLCTSTIYMSKAPPVHTITHLLSSWQKKWRLENNARRVCMTKRKGNMTWLHCPKLIMCKKRQCCCLRSCQWSMCPPLKNRKTPWVSKLLPQPSKPKGDDDSFCTTHPFALSLYILAEPILHIPFYWAYPRAKINAFSTIIPKINSANIDYQTIL